MKTLKAIFFPDSMTLTGILAIVVSFALFLFVDPQTGRWIGIGGNLFFLTYLISIAYSTAILITAFARHRWQISRSPIAYTVIVLILWLISAFSLNLDMHIFDNSAGWLSVYLLLSCTGLMLSNGWQHFSRTTSHIVYFILGAAIPLCLYFSIYLVPLYIWSVPAILLLGISLHTFVPLCITILCITLCVKAYHRQPLLRYSILSGLATPIIIAVAFCIYWDIINEQLVRASQKSSLKNEHPLPTWVYVSQTLTKNFMTERVVKAELVYPTFDAGYFWSWRGLGGRSFDEKATHDPLIMLASMFGTKPELTLDERIKILETLYDSRHQAQERLWSGDGLQTHSVISNVRLYPEYRMAYTEKTIRIRNRYRRGWNAREEAIYSFHLPEGSVISSLSLWINGKEEKALLTTNAKADSAYKTVVGAERRDPSVIHWQEGNTVSVRIFPCTPNEDRQFKIGITSPLQEQDGKLVYENSYFDGPAARRASELVQLSYSSKPSSLSFAGYEEIKPGTFQLSRHYQASWQLTMDKAPLAYSLFTFDGHRYQLQDYQTAYATFDPASIYLDLNKAWSQDEFEQVWHSAHPKKIYVYDGELVQLTEENKDALFKKLHRLNFSLFPFYRINDPQTALCISKSAPLSPNISDLRGSVFNERLSDYFNRHGAYTLHLYHLGTEASPYIKALHELRFFQYQHGNTHQLADQLHQKKFSVQPENDQTVCLEQTGMVIKESVAGDTIPPFKSKAPDHLLRLYAYNALMRALGPHYFDPSDPQQALSPLAAKAHIVSPVSSLIVLETQNDYKRFGIEESKNSLKNASLTSEGAVPEPQEWMLIIVGIGVISYFYYKQTFRKQRS